MMSLLGGWCSSKLQVQRLYLNGIQAPRLSRMQNA